MRPGQTAPECFSGVAAVDQIADASMRPGQTAPECPFVGLSLSFGAGRFNEAGADCPGMQ